MDAPYSTCENFAMRWQCAALVTALGVGLGAACGGSGGSETQWALVADQQPAALLAVWGSSERDVWIVGGDARTGDGPQVWHWDGAAWTRLPTPVTNVDLWWVHGFAGGPVFIGGSGGTILRYAEGAFEVMPTPATQTVFGIWGATPDDLWAVGGNFGGAGGAFAWHYQGTDWVDSTEVPEDVASQGTIFKVTGLSADNVWMAGTNGLSLNWNGTSLVRDTITGDDSLFSASADAGRVMMVGGSAGGVVAEHDGSSWRTTAPENCPLLNGVWVSGDDAVVVGREGAVLRGGHGTWTREDASPTTENLHSAWMDPLGGVWAVGGRFDQPRTEAGVLIYGGDLPPANMGGP